MKDFSSKFIDQMRSQGLDAPSEIVANGEFHRFGPKKSQWYVLNADGMAAFGAFGDWRTGEVWHFKSSAGRTWSLGRKREHDEQVERLKAQAEARVEAARASARALAKHAFDLAEGVGRTAYMDRKKIADLYGARIDQAGNLLVPMVDETGELHGYQTIYSDGSKYFLSGQRTSGTFHVIGEAKADAAYLCEGFATASTIHEATGKTAVVAFNAGNLVHVAEALSKAWPETKLIIAADNDWQKPTNAGLTSAARASKFCAGRIVSPKFGPGDEGLSDFNDVHLRDGIERVREYFKSEIEVVDVRPVSIFELEAASEETTKQSKIADALIEASRGRLFFSPDTYRWWTFTDCWRSESEANITKKIIEQLSGLIAGGFTDSYVNGVCNLIKKTIAEPPEPMGRNFVPFKDGYFDLTTKEFKPHSVDAFFEWCLPYERSHGRETPVIDRVLRNVAGRNSPDCESKVQVLMAFMAACLNGMYEVEKYLELIGEAGGGKSTITNIAQLVVGLENVATSSLDRLDQGRFETATFYGKRLVTFPDQDDYGGTGSMLKRATGGDMLPYEVKGKPVTKPGFVYEGMIIVTANNPVKFKDQSTAMVRRRIPIIVNSQVPASERDHQIMDKIRMEIPNFINRLLEMKREEILWSLSTETGLYAGSSKEILEVTNDIAGFLADECVADPSHEMVSNDLYSRYVIYCDQVNKRPVSRQKFSVNLRQVGKSMGIEIKLRRTNQKRLVSGVRWVNGWSR